MQRAEETSDENLLRRIRGYDLFAAGARLHSSCRSVYTRNENRWRSSDHTTVERQCKLQETHANVFKTISKVISEKIIKGKEIVKLTYLQNLYVHELNFTDFPNEDYRCEKLKRKIENDQNLSQQVSFVKLDDSSKCQGYLIYSKQMELSEAIVHAYSLG